MCQPPLIPSVLQWAEACGCCSGDSRLSRRFSRPSNTPLLLRDLWPMQDRRINTLGKKNDDYYSITTPWHKRQLCTGSPLASNYLSQHIYKQWWKIVFGQFQHFNQTLIVMIEYLPEHFLCFSKGSGASETQKQMEIIMLLIVNKTK